MIRCCETLVCCDPGLAVIPLVSPTSGRALVADTPHSLSDGAGERWPVVDDIPFLRTDSEGLVAVALDHLDAGCPDDALVALLTDQDDWWTGPATDLGELKRLVRERDTLTLREAMALLRFGPVADYFAYRWSDPTYLAGLALLEAHWAEPSSAFELACGIGHYLRELTARGIACTGADVVFAKCWLAKHWVARQADYVVFDAAAPWPIVPKYDLVMCHDAFYFLPQPDLVADRLRGVMAEFGTLAVSRVHNAEHPERGKAPALTADALAPMFPGALVHDQTELLAALLHADAPLRFHWDEIDRTTPAAFAFVEGGFDEPWPVIGGVAMPREGATLRRNPLLGAWGPNYPSELYRAEYGDGCFWALADDALPAGVAADPVRLRRVVDLPERW